MKAAFLSFVTVAPLPATDAQGRFEFRTIRPRSHPRESVPAHIHPTLVTKCCGRQSAEPMFEDDPLVSQGTSYTIKLRPKGDF